MKRLAAILVVLGIACRSTTEPVALTSCIHVGDTIGVLQRLDDATHVVTECIWLTSDVRSCDTDRPHPNRFTCTLGAKPLGA